MICFTGRLGTSVDVGFADESTTLLGLLQTRALDGSELNVLSPGRSRLLCRDAGTSQAACSRPDQKPPLLRGLHTFRHHSIPARGEADVASRSWRRQIYVTPRRIAGRFSDATRETTARSRARNTPCRSHRWPAALDPAQPSVASPCLLVALHQYGFGHLKFSRSPDMVFGQIFGNDPIGRMLLELGGRLVHGNRRGHDLSPRHCPIPNMLLDQPLLIARMPRRSRR